MSAIPYIDSSKLSPSTLETLARFHFSTKRVEAFLPVLLATYVDALCLGVLAILFGLWIAHARPTDHLAHRLLVVGLR
jgi:hypothetical protein